MWDCLIYQRFHVGIHVGTAHLMWDSVHSQTIYIHHIILSLYVSIHVCYAVCVEFWRKASRGYGLSGFRSFSPARAPIMARA